MDKDLDSLIKNLSQQQMGELFKKYAVKVNSAMVFLG